MVDSRYDDDRVGGPSAALSTPFSEIRGMEEYERLKELVEAAADDVAKASGGNKAAGTRVRKAMQDVKDTAQQVRKKILEVRSQVTD